MAAHNRIIISTTPEIPSRKVEAVLGPVFANAASDLEDYKFPLETLQKQALDLEADAIIGLSQSTAAYRGKYGWGITTFLGTAVKLANE